VREKASRKWRTPVRIIGATTGARWLDLVAGFAELAAVISVMKWYLIFDEM